VANNKSSKETIEVAERKLAASTAPYQNAGGCARLDEALLHGGIAYNQQPDD